jgi:hypothetical protein
MTFTKDGIKSTLKTYTANVTFTKVDGSERVMKCTLNETLIPQSTEEKKTDRVKVENDNVLAVWDLESQGWRSFKIDSVKSVQRA